MSRRPTFAIACREPLNKPLTVDDAIAQILCIIRGRMFGPKSVEVRFMKLMLQHFGYEVLPIIRSVTNAR